MSGLRGSVTPTGKRTAAFDYPAQVAAMHQQSATLSTPIHIQPRASPRPSSTTSNAAMVAQSCPTFGWAPPPAPSARPRLPSVDPPSLELPPSPPVFSPLQQEAVKTKKEEPTSIALKKQIYSRSLSNYSSSAPANGGIDYLSKFAPNFGSVDEAVDDSDEEEEENPSNYRPSARAMQTSSRVGADLDDDSPLEPAQQSSGRPIGIGIGAAGKSSGNAQNIARMKQVASGDDFSLSKSPTIFSILSTSQQGAGLHAGAAASSSATSPGHPLLNSIAAGGEPKQQSRRSMIANKATSPDQEDDLQFSISLDEQDGEPEDAGNSNQDSLPLY